MTSRYCYCPMTTKRIGHRMTPAERFRRWKAKRKMAKPDLYMVTGFYPPVYPGK